MKKNLESRNITVSDARLEYIPHLFHTLKAEELQKAGELLDRLETVEDVLKVYSNIKGEELS